MQPDVCLTVVLDEADNFLVIKRSKRSTNAGRWEPPVGHREPGESPEDAALREVAEETGLSVQLLSGTTDKRSDDGGGLRLFLARANGTKPEVKTEPSEHDAHKWLTLDEMNALEDCHDSLKADISKLLKANSQTKEANMLPIAGQSAGVPFAPRFSGTYQPKLSGPPNPLASVKAPAVAKADTAGVQQALAKTGSMCPSATGEGKKMYKVNPEDTAIGEKAFESLDRFKRAGLNSFQASFFSRMVNEGRSVSHIKQAIAVAGKQFGTKVAGELQEGFNKLSNFNKFAFDIFGKGPAVDRFKPPPKTQAELYGNRPAIVGKDPSNIAKGGGRNFLQNYGFELQRNFVPGTDAWSRDTYGSDSWMKNLSRGAMGVGLGAGAGAVALGGAGGAGSAALGLARQAGPAALGLARQAGPAALSAARNIGPGIRNFTAKNFPTFSAAASRLGNASRGSATNPAAGGGWGSFLGGQVGNAVGLGLLSQMIPSTDDVAKSLIANENITPLLDLANRAKPGGGLIPSSDELINKMLENQKIKPLLDLANQASAGNGLIPSSDDLINKMIEHPKLKPLFDLAQNANSGGNFDLAGMFAKNQNWLIPLLAATAVGGLGGGALGGTGGALGGAIGLPLIYYLMQNPDAMNQLMGGAQTARKPPAAPPAAPPQQKWHAPMRLPAAPPVAPPTAPPVAPPAAPPPA